METLLAFIQPLIEAYAGQFGIVVQIIAIVGSLRIFIKPIMSLVGTVVLFTKTQSDDVWYAKLQENKIFKGFVYLIDWFASIKIAPKAEVKK